MSGSAKNNDRFLIAVVDDDQSVREALESLLRSLGFRVATFAAPRDFLGSPELANVSCAILDICMPSMNGIEAQRHLIAKQPIPVIFITAYGSERMERQVTRAGATRLLKKPFSDEALIDALNAALGI
jgi:FixJ family two-component response regulator